MAKSPFKKVAGKAGFQPEWKLQTELSLDEKRDDMAKVNQLERAYFAWNVVADRAMKHEKITYGELAAAIGVHHRPLRYVLGEIQDYCLKHFLPPLTIIVVDKNGKIGPGFFAYDLESLEEGRREVYDYPWNVHGNPFALAKNGESIQSIVSNLLTGTSTPEEIYRKVKIRGAAQMVFREALLQAYGGKCAFCGLTFEAALSACHIKPWNESSAKERISPTNGILLCGVHHELFDKGYMTLTVDGVIKYFYHNDDLDEYSSTDKIMSVQLHGHPAMLPSDKALRPSRDALEYRHKIQNRGKEDLI